MKHGKPEADDCEDVPSMQISYTIRNTHIILHPKRHKQSEFHNLKWSKTETIFDARSKAEHQKFCFPRKSSYFAPKRKDNTNRQLF